MEPIIIEPTRDTPGVVLDPANNKFEMNGKSLPEDVASFYDPILAWIEEYSESPNEETVFEMKMSYFNTASSKMLLDILFALEELAEGGNNVKINWHYKENDEDMMEAGEEYADIVEIPFEHFSYS